MSKENFEVTQLRRAYQKQWRAKNRDRVRSYNERYWINKAEKLKSKEEEETENGDTQNANS